MCTNWDINDYFIFIFYKETIQNDRKKSPNISEKIILGKSNSMCTNWDINDYFIFIFYIKETIQNDRKKVQIYLKRL